MSATSNLPLYVYRDRDGKVVTLLKSIPVQNGSQSAPAYTFNNSTNSGFYLKQSSPAVIGVAIDGSEVVTIDSTGIATGGGGGGGGSVTTNTYTGHLYSDDGATSVDDCNMQFTKIGNQVFVSVFWPTLDSDPAGAAGYSFLTPNSPGGTAFAMYFDGTPSNLVPSAYRPTGTDNTAVITCCALDNTAYTSVGIFKDGNMLFQSANGTWTTSTVTLSSTSFMYSIA